MTEAVEKRLVAVPAAPAGKRGPVDPDRLIDYAVAVGAIIGYFVSAAIGGVLLGGYWGAFVFAGFMLPPLAYTLVKQNQRKARAAERGAADGFRGEQAPAGGSSGIRVYE